MDVGRLAEQAEAKRTAAAELRRIARTILAPGDRAMLVSIASSLEVEAATLDDEQAGQRERLRA